MTDSSARFRRVQFDGSAEPIAVGTPTRRTGQPIATPEADVARRIESEVTSEVAALRTTVQRLSASIGTHRAAASRNAQIRARSGRADADAEQQRQLTAIEVTFAERARTKTEIARAALSALSPGSASAEWEAPGWATPNNGPASYFRIGATSTGLPALAPLLDRSGWAFAGDRDTTAAHIEGTLLRIVTQVPLGFLRVRIFDPRIEGRLGIFSRLRQVSPATVRSPAHDLEGLREHLAELASLASANAETMGAHHAGSLAQLWRTAGIPTGAFGIMVVLNYPMGVDEAAQQALIRLAETAAPRGVCLLVQHARNARAGSGVDPDDLVRHLELLSLGSNTIEWRGLPANIVVRCDPPPPRELFDTVIGAATAAAATHHGPLIALADLLAEESEGHWIFSAHHELIATIGRDGRDPVSLTLRSENPPHPNILIGGAVGQGKSNLLLDIVYSLAARYSPDELEMLLLDFKRGLEFKRFDKDESGRNWLPHARVLSLESNREFGLAVLQHVAGLLETRAELFNEARCNGYTEYRERTGRLLPRVLVIIDEFHVQFDGDDPIADRAVALLDSIARQGRAFGIHLLLSSQTVSGISGLRVKGESIFAQFPLRISLKNTREESEAVLSRHNTAAADLQFRGEMIINRNLGIASDGANIRAVAAFADPDYVRDLQERLWQRCPAPREPWVFLGRSFAPWPAQPKLSPDRPWIGMPVEVTDQPIRIAFDNDTDQAVAIVGTGNRIADAVLGSIALSWSAGAVVGARIVVLDGDGTDRPWLPALSTAFEAHDIEVEVVGRDMIARRLLDVTTTQLTGAPPTLIIGIGLQKVPEFDVEIPVDPAVGFGPTMSARAALHELATRGATYGFHLVGWWSTLRALTVDLGYDHAGVGTYVLLDVGLEDRRTIVGPHATAPTDKPRATFVDRNGSGHARLVVPFEPVTAEVAHRWFA